MVEWFNLKYKIAATQRVVGLNQTKHDRPTQSMEKDRVSNLYTQYVGIDDCRADAQTGHMIYETPRPI